MISSILVLVAGLAGLSFFGYKIFIKKENTAHHGFLSCVCVYIAIKGTAPLIVALFKALSQG